MMRMCHTRDNDRYMNRIGGMHRWVLNTFSTCIVLLYE